MKSNPKIRRTMLAALLVFATVAIGLQPFVGSAPSDCGCQAAAAALEAASADSSCCGVSVAAQVTAQKPSPCCCNPEASVCMCIDCHCGDAKTPSVPSPAIPGNQTTEVVWPTLVCASPLIWHPKQNVTVQTVFSNAVVEFTALSSQQTCVLLSRFTC